MSQDIEQKEVRVDLDLADSLPPVRLIAHQLQNIFLSLLKESLSTAGPGSSLEIQTQRGQFDNLSITISRIQVGPETPPGSDPFDPLAGPNREARLALGLSISWEIIIEHGGSLEMSGENGKTFRLSLPLA